VDLNIPADMSAALPQLVSACRDALGSNGASGEREQRRTRLTERHDQLRGEWQTRARETSEQTPVSVPKLASDLWECIKGEDWALVGGNLAGWARRIWDINQPQHYQGGSGGAGLGYVAGAALGGALALKGTGKLCVSLQPDGDFMFSPGALWTAAHHRIPLLTIMYNNRTYFNSEEHAVDVARNRERDVEKRGEGIWISGPEIDYATMARSMGVYGEGPIDRPEEVIPAVQRAMRVVQEQQLPALVDVVCQPR
jgi:thiamine pyrophosphate-dependent acetolactate synthase large subunit-like protein